MFQSRPPAVKRLATSAKSQVAVDAEVFLYHARLLFLFSLCMLTFKPASPAIETRSAQNETKNYAGMQIYAKKGKLNKEEVSKYLHERCKEEGTYETLGSTKKTLKISI